jgi:parallel beta-helix repeat protein
VDDCISITGSYIDVIGLECRNPTQAGIYVWGGHHIRILNNIVHDTIHGGILAGYDSKGVVSDLTISGNTVYRTVLENQPRTAGSQNASVAMRNAKNIVISNNHIYESWGEGIVLPVVENATVTGNILHDNYSVELYMDNTINSTFANNFVYSTGNTDHYRYGQPARCLQFANETYAETNASTLLNNNKIINNVCVGPGPGLYYGNYGTGGGMKNTLIANNTFHGPYTQTIVIDSDTHQNVVVANNIFNVTGGSGSINYQSGSGIVFRNNLWNGINPGPAAGTGDVSGNPQFVQPGVGQAAGYKLMPGSPAINMANAADSPAADFAGVPRPQGSASDIGAFEAVP